MLRIGYQGAEEKRLGSFLINPFSVNVCCKGSFENTGWEEGPLLPGSALLLTKSSSYWGRRELCETHRLWPDTLSGEGKAILPFLVKFQKLYSNGEEEESLVKELPTRRGMSKIEGNQQRMCNSSLPYLWPPQDRHCWNTGKQWGKQPTTGRTHQQPLV